ncbi:hypothetical protein PVK06_035561 [Gossypium arboreum]|uniref:Reverse transcriptase domain-containing protein n=1 Tax=Gossypium arboreum TaxID=29729 RepID=A0ABR0NHN7_GOSAR|nr:hypothetical protein PVK06_035561 [Gossypium arboreum]
MRIKNNVQWMAVNIDLEKVYDRAHWDFIQASLKEADDLVIFSKADLKHSGLLKSFLSNFCELFGHRVNTNKTDVFFSNGVKDDIKRNINNTLSFQEVKDLGLYLEAPLFHQRVTKNTLDFLVERVRNHLSSGTEESFLLLGGSL